MNTWSERSNKTINLIYFPCNGVSMYDVLDKLGSSRRRRMFELHYHPCSPPKLLNHIMSCHVDGAPHVIKLDSSNILRLLLLPSLSKTSYIDTPLQGKYIRFIVLLLLSLHVFMYFTGSQTMVRYYFPVEVNMLYGALREQFTATTHFDRDPQLEQLTT